MKYLAGNRITGTSAERTGTSLPSGTNVGWKEVGRKKLGANATSCDVTGIPNKPYYMVLYNMTAGRASDFSALAQFNDNGSNYDNIDNSNGGNNSTSDVGGSWLRIDNGWVASGTGSFAVQFISNLVNRNKLSMTWYCNTGNAVGAATPNRKEIFSKWVNDDVIDEINLINVSGGNYNADTEVVVLGYDPTDTSTDNFWEELTPAGGATLTGTASEISSGTITAKKYLWIQLYYPQPAGALYTGMGFNGDRGSNYNWRCDHNYHTGSTERTDSSSDRDEIRITESRNYANFINCFAVNIDGEEKLVQGHGIQVGSTGNNEPQGDVFAGKWRTSSGQITSVQFFPHTGTYPSGTILKVWGHD